MIVLLGYFIASGYFGHGLAFMFTPDFDKLSWDSVLAAMGQAFFTLSIGMGAVMAYGAYLPEETSITGASAAVVTADTAIAMLAGLVIFPLVFANGLDPADGPGLVFDTLPLAFGQMSGGIFFSTIFFILLAFAAWTSAIGLMEPAVAWIVEHLNHTRAQSTVMVGLLIWLLGVDTNPFTSKEEDETVERDRDGFPPPPQITSLPLRPWISSFPARPWMTSGPSVP